MTKTDELLLLLNTFGQRMIDKTDLYNWLMGDAHALDKYQGDTDD